MMGFLLLLSTAALLRECVAFSAAPRTASSSSSPLWAATVDEASLSEAEPTNGYIPASQMDFDDANPFNLLAGRATVCLVESDMRRDSNGPKGAEGTLNTNWINDESAFALQKAFDKITLKLANERTGVDRDECSTWLRWMKSTPTPLIVDLSDDLRAVANFTVNDHVLDLIDMSREEFLSRIGCRLVLLPSGASLQSPFTEPPASIIYGKLLYGGATRYRLLVSSNSNRPPRRAGERTEVKTSVTDNIPVWMMYGGPDRMYEAADMGAAAVLEVMLLPRGTELPSIMVQANKDMAVSRIVWKPQKMFRFLESDSDGESDKTSGSEANDSDELLLGTVPSALSGKARNEAFQSDFRSSVGGLRSQIEAIVRRVLDGRVIRPAEVVDSASDEDETTAELAVAALEAEELSVLGLTPVRGLLLYGPPGCGKTQLAREISRALRARQPKIVSAPELLDRWVGGSEKLVRGLFADAEAELAACNGDATRSALHVIVIDEIDAVFRKRSGGEDSGEATRASAVNQILAKLDGINAISNVLMIGMTNRRELLDEALLRPGRLEVQIEIPLPNKEGRREILQIHFRGLREKGRLSQPLCCAIDGVAGFNDDASFTRTNVDDETPTVERRRKRDVVKSTLASMIPDAVRPTYDIASDSVTGGFSGADIAGLVRCAGSIALSRARQDGNGVEGLLITLEDVKQALKEVQR